MVVPRSYDGNNGCHDRFYHGIYIYIYIYIYYMNDTSKTANINFITSLIMDIASTQLLLCPIVVHGP